jgi:hypothetical protein
MIAAGKQKPRYRLVEVLMPVNLPCRAAYRRPDITPAGLEKK